MTIALRMDAGRSTLSINGVTAPLRDSQDEAIAWRCIKLALFDKHPEYAIGKLLRAS